MVAAAAIQQTQPDAVTAAGQAAPKGYKRTELGVIPEDWEVKQLGDLGDCIIGLTYKPSSVKSDGVLVLRSSNIQNDRIEFEDNVFVEMDVPTKLFVQPNDILVCVRNGSRALIGKCALIDERAKGAAFGAFMSVYRSPHGRFIFNQFQADGIKKQINENIGATINQITNKNLNAFKIPFPPEDNERGAIAEALSDVDEWVASLDALIAKRRGLKTATMQQLLTGHTRLPGFTGEWETKKLGEIGYFVSGNGFPIIYQGEKSGDYPFFKVSDMNNDGNSTFMSAANHYVSRDVAKKLCANIIPINSIVFAKIGAAIFLERKKILAQDSCLDNNMMAFVVDKSTGNHRYFHYLLLSIELGKLVSATALPSLSGKEIGSLDFSLPQLKEQTAIATILSDMDADIAALEAEREKASAIKQGMMQELLTGKTRLV